MDQADPKAALLHSAETVAAFTGARAAAQDRGEADLGEEIALLHRTGLLRGPLDPAEGGSALGSSPATVAVTLEALVILGGANLSLARLFEGHVNAVKFVGLYGSREQRSRVAGIVRDGGMLGVWGADGKTPARLAGRDGGFALTGSKRYASGLGLVRLAIVYVRDEADRTRLVLVEAGEAARSDLSDWRMRGMRASRSGSYDLGGLLLGEAALLGPPDAYRTEPWFVGGIWRCAAAQLGAVERIVGEVRAHLAAGGRDGHPLQLERLGHAIMEARTARLWIADAAVRVESGRDVERSVALAAFARLRTEAAGLAAIRLAERGVGLPGFSEDHPLERLTRDLAVYLRQSNPDALLLDHTRVLLADLPFGAEP